ncbi:MAG: geranylgeranylglyceryl/heptaprenylglyceryl phosphate synthase [Saprospiraceae bacterium]|nr:geranylgeranylglyceryl/heptaprenylglyceryl phosphate synthase [Saprospiraceae bacterium]
MRSIYQEWVHAKNSGKKSLAVLVDPDELRIRHLDRIIEMARVHKVDYFFVGGSLVMHDRMDHCLRTLKSSTSIPIILFPGSTYQISEFADAILFMSLISGRNPELLIGQQVLAAPILKNSPLEIISTGYMLIDGGSLTSASYISHTLPIPSNKPDIAVCTAMAGEMLGLSTLYLDAGSGARHAISDQMISAVSENVNVPLIIGGGIREAKALQNKLMAGADIVVVGNAIESEPGLIAEMTAMVRELNLSFS